MDPVTKNSNLITNRAGTPDSLVSLPEELFQHILSFLDGREKQNNVRVARYWNAGVISATQNQEFNSIRNFCATILEFLNTMEPKPKHLTIQELERLFVPIRRSNLFVDCIDLKTIKVISQSYKNRIAFALGSLTFDQLLKLEDHFKHLPQFFNDVFVLAKLYARIEVITDIDEQLDLPSEIINECWNNGYKHLAYEFAIRFYSVCEEWIRSQVVKSFAEQQMDIAKTLIKHVRSPYGRVHCVKELILHVSREADCDLIMEEIKLFALNPELDGFSKQAIKSSLIEKLIALKLVEKAITCVGEFAQDQEAIWIKSKLYFAIVKELISQERYPQAFEVAVMITESSEYTLSMQNLIKVLIEDDKITLALEFSSKMQEETNEQKTVKGEWLFYVAEALANKGNREKAIEIARTVKDMYKSISGISDIKYRAEFILERLLALKS